MNDSSRSPSSIRSLLNILVEAHNLVGAVFVVVLVALVIYFVLVGG